MKYFADADSSGVIVSVLAYSGPGTVSGKIEIPEDAYALYSRGNRVTLTEDGFSATEIAPDYATLRRMAYPPLQDLADALYWQSNGDSSKLDAYLSNVALVKSIYPKP